MPEPNVRLAREGDQAQLLTMQLAPFPGAGPDDLAPEIQAHVNGAPQTPMASDLYVYEHDDGNLGGFVEVALRSVAEGAHGHSPVGYLEAIYVHDDLWRQGVGSKLVAAAERWATDQGCQHLASDALLENVASQRFHEGAGFAEVERAVHYVKALE